MKVLEATTRDLSYLLALTNGTLSIPYNQRPYEWKKEQVLRLFNDFYSTYLNKSTKHILNFITLKNDEENEQNNLIFDGQQRSVTSLLILSAIINKLKKLDDDSRKSADRLTSIYLYDQHWKNTDKVNYKIVFENEIANNMLHKYIFKDSAISESHVFSDYDVALYNNYIYIQELLDNTFTANPKREQLLEFAEAILNRVLVVIIETSYENIAEEMFETLNSTGLQLEDFYVLKNALIRSIGEESVKPQWSLIESNTDRINKNKFLSGYLNAINGKTPTTKLYSRIEDIINLESKSETEIFLNELVQASKIYLEIENPAQKNQGSSLEILSYSKLINLLSKLNANQYKPVLIAMGLKDFSLSDVNITLQKILSLQLRNIFIADLNANTLEQFYPSLAKEIYTGSISNVDGIVEKISVQIVPDSFLKEKFISKVILSRTDESTIRTILKEIYNNDHPEIRINDSSVEVSLEHILPKNPNDQSKWLKNFSDPEKRFNFTRNIGNLTVLLGKINSSIKNADFSDKKSSYAQSRIPENISLSTLDDWNQEYIISRNEELFLRFITIWTK